MKIDLVSSAEGTIIRYSNFGYPSLMAVVVVISELLQSRNRHPKADTANTITLLKSKRRMSQHVCNGSAICTDEAKTQVG